MKPSNFNIFIPLQDKKKLIFNTFSDSRVIGDSDVIEAIETCTQPHLLSKKQKEQLQQLKELGIVIDDNVDEEREIEYWFQGFKFDSSTINTTILTTFACNMKCVYCFEQGVNSNLSMKQKMAEKVCNWLVNKMEDVRPKELIVTFFGGEPLLNLEAVKYISKTLYYESEKRGVVLKIAIITNGLLITEELVNTLKPFGLERIKVTLDGDEITHNRMRPRKVPNKNGRGTYRDIMNNLLKIKGKVPIVIGGNYDDTTKRHIPALLDDLKNMGFGDEIKEIAFKPILGFPGHEKESLHLIEACTFSETNLDDLLWLIRETEKRGFKPIKKVALGPCEAMREYTYTIDPTGDIYKCAAMAGRKEYAVGNIDNDSEEILFNPKNVAFMTADLWRKCKKCKFIPICGGGCRIGAILQKKDIYAISCEKEYFEKVSTKLVVSEM